MSKDFNIKKIEKYAEQVRQNQFKQGKEFVPINDLTTDAILFCFDKNKDGKISKREFEQVTKENYSLFAEELKKYNTAQGDDSHVFTYNELNNFLEDGFIDEKDLTKNTKNLLDTNLNLPEQKNLKNLPQMSEEELQAEMEMYGLDITKGKKKLTEIRKERNNIDENSDIIDWHIGTFNQNELPDCSLLARIANLTDEELKNIYTKKQDKKGNIYYEVNFPSDDGKKPVKVTEEELNYMSIKHKGKEILGFSTGDKDVMLLEMAYIKRYGSDITTTGVMLNTPITQFANNYKAQYYLEITEDMLTNDKVKSLCLLDPQLLKNLQNIENGEVTFASGQKGQLYDKKDGIEIVGQQRLQLPDGTIIYGQHAYAVKSYNPETKEVILSNPLENSTEIVVPYEALKLFYIAE